MILDERRSLILQVVEEKGFASLQDLMDRVDASESTIRRDLEYLDGIGQVRRTRGGAAYVGESISAFDDRQFRASAEKQKIARAVAEMVQDDETILLDGGTTTLEVARQLNGKSLQVVTNSLPIANLLVNRPNTELVLLGGFLYPKTGVALGPHAVAQLSRIHVGRLVMSAGGVTEKGLFNSNALLVETERTMIESAEEVILVSDSSKFGHSALAHLCPLDVVNHIVVDSGLSDEWRQHIETVGVKLTLVD